MWSTTTKIWWFLHTQKIWFKIDHQSLLHQSMNGRHQSICIIWDKKQRKKHTQNTNIHTQRMNSFDETDEENDIINRHWIFFQRFREYIFLRPETRNHIWYYCMLNVNRINTCQFTTNLRAKQSLGRWIHSLSQYIVIIAL